MVREYMGSDQWAVILGGSSGLGLATVERLARAGLHICVVYRVRRKEAAETASYLEGLATMHGVRIVSHNVDGLKADNRADVLANLAVQMGTSGKVRVLVHSVAKGNLKPIISDDETILRSDDFRLTIEAMGISLYDWTYALYDGGLFGPDARVISFTSQGNQRAWPSYAAVSAAKVTLESITRSIAMEMASVGIKANCIQAGITDTASLRMIPGHERLKEHSISRNPNGRLTTPEDVADVVYLLTKDEAQWITGAIIPVDGGEHLS